MSVQHDNQWLEALHDGEIETDQGVVIAGLKTAMIYACRHYHEHMQSRWLPMVLLPEVGQRIEIVWRSRSWHSDWSSVENFDGKWLDANQYDDGSDNDGDMEIGHQYAWRPVGGLPE